MANTKHATASAPPQRDRRSTRAIYRSIIALDSSEDQRKEHQLGTQSQWVTQDITRQPRLFLKALCRLLLFQKSSYKMSAERPPSKLHNQRLIALSPRPRYP